MNTQTLYKSDKLVQEIATRNQITEREILLIKRRLNNGEQIDLQTIWDNPVKLTSEQNDKGISFLRNLWKTPNGVERKNNPFGYREEAVLESFEYFELAGFYDAGNLYRSFYLPLYNCVGKERRFQYYYDGNVNIIG